MYSHGRDVHETETLKRGWKNVRVVETILEEDDEEDEDLETVSSSSVLSFAMSSPSSLLRTGVDAWTLATGREPDVKILVGGVCFQLHKDILITKSSYFKRHLSRLTEFTLSPPLKLTADTFKQVADFWYTNHLTVTPSNVAALRMASELLETNDNSGKSLREITELYLCNVLHSREFTCDVFLSSLSLLPEAELTAYITSRCLEAMLGEVNDGGGGGCVDGLKTVSPEDFRVVVESMQRRFTRSHDLLYRVVDLYFQVHKGKILSEEQKTQIISCIDCSLISAHLLMHAVQNPRMPLRFVVQAMLTTQRSLFTASTNCHPRPAESPATLRAFLERDAALRQADQMRAVIDSTCSRIQTLEKELSCMRKLLGDQQKAKQEGILLLKDGRNSASCRFNNNNNNRSQQKVERGERGSVSSSMVRLFGGVNSSNTGITKHGIDESSLSLSLSAYLQIDEHRKSREGNGKKSVGQRLIRGLRSAFGGGNNKMNKGGKLDDKLYE
ncbi:hypothetical protein vseg_019447 [Gypsophila vaccaria]